MEQIHIFQRIFNFIAWLTIASMAVLVLLFGYWYLVPITPITFEAPFKVEAKEVKSGGYQYYLVKYCKYTRVIPQVSKTFIDGVLYTVPPEPAILNPMGCGERRVQQYIPKALPEGTYHISITYHYQINPIRHIDVVAQTEQFKILPNGVK